MRKSFYTSGFLYHLPSQQILLQQRKSLTPLWSLFGAKSHKAENPIAAFSKITSKELRIKIPAKEIHPIYDYFNKKLNHDCYLFYAVINNKEKKIPARKGYNVEWFTVKQISKLSIDEQTKQDIMVGKRVIDAAARSKEASKTPNGH